MMSPEVSWTSLTLPVIMFFILKVLLAPREREIIGEDCFKDWKMGSESACNPTDCTPVSYKLRFAQFRPLTEVISSITLVRDISKGFMTCGGISCFEYAYGHMQGAFTNQAVGILQIQTLLWGWKCKPLSRKGIRICCAKSVLNVFYKLLENYFKSWIGQI